MKIQLINIKPITLRIENNNYQFVKPKYLLPNNQLKLIEAKIKGSTMVWNICNKQVSYNQIKKLINDYSKSNKIN